MSSDLDFKKAFYLTDTVFGKVTEFTDEQGVRHVRMKVRPYKRVEDNCPICHKRCPYYDTPSEEPQVWILFNVGGSPAELEYVPHRINCPEHGIQVADVPWAYPGHKFSKAYERSLRRDVQFLPREVISLEQDISLDDIDQSVSGAGDPPEEKSPARGKSGRRGKTGADGKTGR